MIDARSGKVLSTRLMGDGTVPAAPGAKPRPAPSLAKPSPAGTPGLPGDPAAQPGGEVAVAPPAEAQPAASSAPVVSAPIAAPAQSGKPMIVPPTVRGGASATASPTSTRDTDPGPPGSDHATPTVRQVYPAYGSQ